LASEKLLATRREEFFAAHPPVTWQAAEDHEPVDPNAYQPKNWSGERFIISQSWWLASEFVRRHPELVIHEMHPGGGMCDVLCVFEPGVDAFGGTTQVMLNRAGTIQVHYPQPTERHPERIASWLEVTDDANPHRFLRRIEDAAGLGHPSKAPASTPRALAYRFISTALTMLGNDRHRWYARNEFWDTSSETDYEEDDDLRQYLTRFPAAVRDLEHTTRLGVVREPFSYFWALLRDEEPVAILSIEGRLYLPDHFASRFSTESTTETCTPWSRPSYSPRSSDSVRREAGLAITVRGELRFAFR
jgi:hypothetical protein